MTCEFPSFAAFHRDVYGVEPFPWQAALAERITADGRWPDTIDIPTGLGKTRTMAVALWHLAGQLHTGVARTAPLRILHVVDRTSIVDQTHGDLVELDAALREAVAGSPAGVVADVLRAEYGTPLTIDKVHGADRDTGDWHDLDRPVVVTMTAHQAVSRALFRGFGVSAGMSPVHAALVGIDSLVLFDEPHLSAASVSTLRAAKAHQARHDVPGIPTGQVVQLGATAAAIPSGTVHTISDADRTHPVASQRLAAVKRLAVHPCASGDRTTAGELVQLARQALASDGAAGMVLVVVNTISLARTIHAALTSGRSAIDPDEALLVTSRIRKHERAAVNATLADRPPRLVVATQTVEAGVDLDASTLVTEICDWPALVQRLGRLNRRGDQTTATAHLVAPEKPRGGTTAVYGEDIATAMGHLAAVLDGADVSPEALAHIAQGHADGIAAATRPALPAPTLTREMLPTLVQTRPRPAADLDLQPFITGVQDNRRITDVTVLWRHSLEIDVAEEVPVDPRETLTVPLDEVNSLIAHRVHGSTLPTTSTLADDGESAPAPTTRPYWATEIPACLVNTGDGWAQATSSTALCPGTVVILPAIYGGHDDTGWNPTSVDPVDDLSPRIAHDTGRWWHADAATAALAADALVVSDHDRAQWDALPGLEPDAAVDLASALLPEELDPLQFSTVTDTGVWVRREPDIATEHRVTVSDHAAHVAYETRSVAQRAGLDPAIVTLLDHAGYHHDDGKTHPTFQAALGARSDGPMLAKLAPGKSYSRGLVPRGWRHESHSVATLPRHTHPLVAHVIAAHHGWARPVMPPASGDGQGIPTADRFEHLNNQYGPWGLAWLEAVMRLADHRASRIPVPGHQPPAGDLPLAAPTASPEQTAVKAPGIEVTTALDWWAAAGLLAAATDLDDQAQLSFMPGLAGHHATLHTTATLEDITAEAVALCREVDSIRDQVAVKNEKAPAHWVRDTLAAESSASRQLSASILDDTQPASHGKLSLRTWWEHNNSTLLGTVTANADSIADVCTRHHADQYGTDTSAYGLRPDAGASLMVSGIPDRVRPPLLALALAATTRLPSTGGPRPIGVTRDGRAALPMPAQPTTWAELLALTQTVPQRPDSPWTTLPIDILWLQRTACRDAKTHAWEPEPTRGDAP